MRDYNSKKPSVKRVAAKRPQNREGLPLKTRTTKKSAPRKTAVQTVKPAKQTKKAENLKVIPIGGLNEIGQKPDGFRI